MADATWIAQLALLGEAAECLEDVAIFVWDDDRNYVAANDAACTLLGRTRDEILQMKVGDMAEDNATDVFERVQHGGPLHTGTLVAQLENGPVELAWVTCRTRIAGLPYMVSVCWRKEQA